MVSVESSLFKVGVISSSFNSFGNFFAWLLACSIFLSDIHSLFQKTLSRFWLEYFRMSLLFVLSRLSISLKISSDVISENWKSSLILIVSFIERTLGWYSNFFIAISTGSPKFSVSLRRDLFSIMSREFSTLL